MLMEVEQYMLIFIILEIFDWYCNMDWFESWIILFCSKATSLDGTFAPAWIGYGNAYAAQEEGDQAMSAYRTASRLFPG